MHHNLKKEKCELNILNSNLITRNKYINKSTNVSRPDSLDIKVKSENVVKPETYLENINSWSSESLDNFILQIKNSNNTPSPVTPNSFFNPSDVTQDQEQFADALTLHLNKIKEDYKSGIDINHSPYLTNVIQMTSISQDKPIPIGTVSVGNKLFLVNQIGHSLDSNDNQCINYGVMDFAVNTTMQQPKCINIHQPLKISQFQYSGNDTGSSSVKCHSLNSSYNQQGSVGISHMIQINNNINNNISKNETQQNHHNFLKTQEGVVYTRVLDSSLKEMHNQNNSISSVSCGNPSVNQNNSVVVKAVVKIDQDRQCLSASSNDNDSSYGTSSVKTLQKDCSSNDNKLLRKDNKDLDDVQRRLERKRARNREAARNCRDRKNSLIASLEQKYAKQTIEKQLIREKLLKSLEEIRRLTEYISEHDPHSKFANFSNFLNEIKIEELTEADLKDLNLL